MTVLSFIFGFLVACWWFNRSGLDDITVIILFLVGVLVTAAVLIKNK